MLFDSLCRCVAPKGRTRLDRQHRTAGDGRPADDADLRAAVRATVREIRIRCRRVKNGKQTIRLVSGVVHFQQSVCPDGSIPFDDADVFAKRRWREVVDILRAADAPMTIVAISRWVCGVREQPPTSTRLRRWGKSGRL